MTNPSADEQKEYYEKLEKILTSYPEKDALTLAKRLENELKISKPGEPYEVQVQRRIGERKLNDTQKTLLNLLEVARRSGTEEQYRLGPEFERPDLGE